MNKTQTIPAILVAAAATVLAGAISLYPTADMAQAVHTTAKGNATIIIIPDKNTFWLSNQLLHPFDCNAAMLVLLHQDVGEKLQSQSGNTTIQNIQISRHYEIIDSGNYGIGVQSKCTLHSLL